MRNGYQSYDGNNEWEQPYYKWESNIDYNGAPPPIDASQSMVAGGFKPLQPFLGFPNEAKGLHWGIRK